MEAHAAVFVAICANDADKPIPIKYWEHQETQRILLQVITRIPAKYDKSDLLSLVIPLLN